MAELINFDKEKTTFKMVVVILGTARLANIGLTI